MVLSHAYKNSGGFIFKDLAIMVTKYGVFDLAVNEDENRREKILEMAMLPYLSFEQR